MLAVISLDSALKKDENHYLQEFLKKCKYIEKKEHAYKVSKRAENYFLVYSSLINLLMLWAILLFKQKEQGVFLNYPYDFKSQSIGM